MWQLINQLTAGVTHRRPIDANEAVQIRENVLKVLVRSRSSMHADYNAVAGPARFGVLNIQNKTEHWKHSK